MEGYKVVRTDTGGLIGWFDKEYPAFCVARLCSQLDHNRDVTYNLIDCATQQVTVYFCNGKQITIDLHPPLDG